MKTLAIALVAAATAAPGLRPPVNESAPDLISMKQGQTAEVTCSVPGGCLFVTVDFMRGYTAYVEQQAARRCNRTL